MQVRPDIETPHSPMRGSTNFMNVAVDKIIVEFVTAGCGRTGYTIEEMIDALSTHWNSRYFSTEVHAEVALAEHCNDPRLS